MTGIGEIPHGLLRAIIAAFRLTAVRFYIIILKRVFFYARIRSNKSIKN